MKTFEVVSDKLIISDPCYELGTWCQGSVKNPKKGTWVCVVKKSDEGGWGIRVAEIICYHQTDEMKVTTRKKWEKLPFTVGVDSGQAEVFDAKFYQDDFAVKKLPTNLQK